MKRLFVFALIFLAYIEPKESLAYVIQDNSVPNEWVLIDTKSKTVFVMNKSKPVKAFKGASFGRGGVGQKRERGDKITPVGSYKIGWENSASQFGHFFGLTYPSIRDANEGVIHRKISIKDYHAIILAHAEGRTPPQDTPLGGRVGIHGLRPGDLPLHKVANWTFGCIALTNEQIKDLSNYLKIGMIIIIG